MTALSVQIEKQNAEKVRFRAVTEKYQSFGRTPGEALDALNAQAHEGDSSLVVIQQVQPDAYFSEAQYLRMRELLDQRPALTDKENQELIALVKAELIASAQRTEALANAFGR